VVAGPELPLTVYPFILRGVQLSGIDSAGISRDRRWAIWERIAGDLNPGDLGDIASLVARSQLNGCIEQILAGKIRGRIVVDLRQAEAG
jgi:hypothetical protein